MHEIQKSVQKLLRHIISVFIASIAVLSVSAADVKGDTIVAPDAAPDENFVTASVVVASPGTILYSVFGHACLRLECPTHGLDFVFSSEAEDAAHNVLQFFAGNLSMGVRAVPTEEYLQQYREEGRAVRQYRLNLPIAVKQRLWQQMDERLQYADVPYDYLNEGCAVSVMHWLEDAIDADSLVFAPWPEKFERSRKEIGHDNVDNPWLRFALHNIIEGEANYTDIRPQDKCIIPADLVEVLQQAKAYGRPLLSKESKQLLPLTKPLHYTWFTPLMLAFLIFALALSNLWLRNKWVRILLWSVYTLLGTLVVYLWLVSPLCCTQWSLLVIPFSVLPLLLWRWRRYWALPFAAIAVLWAVVMGLWPHILVDTPHIVLALAVAAMAAELHPMKKIYKSA